MSTRSPRPQSFAIAASGIVAAAIAILMATAPVARGQLLTAEWHGTGSPDGALGTSVANACDVDGDGVDDLIVGDIYYDTPLAGCGRACVYSGANFAFVREHAGSQAGESAGSAVAGVGDLDVDGCDDYAVGTPYHDTALVDAGSLVVYSGKNGAVLWSAFGAATNARLGASVAGIGDMDTDGLPEVLVGVPGSAGVKVFDEFGNAWRKISYTGTFGTAVGRCADVDSDGYDDFLVSNPSKGTGAGEVVVYSGQTMAYLFGFFGDASADNLGQRNVGALDDVDGDGIDDLFAGAPGSDANGVDSGYVRVVSGATGATLRTHYGDGTAHYMGYALARLSDLDDDGVDDYAAGAANGGAAGMGLVRVFSGKTGGTLWEFEGSADANGTNVYLGSGVAGIALDGDADVDLVITHFAYWSNTAANYLGGVWAYLTCPARAASYGAGWPGKNGVPSLDALDEPVVGATIDIQVGNSLGANTAALLFVGLADANAVTSAGGTLLVTPLFSLPLALPPAGLTVTGTLPDDAALYFLEVFLQAIEADPFASNKLSFTPGLKLRCGFDL